MYHNQDGLVLNFLGKEICYSENQCNYYRCLHQFQIYAQQAAKEYKSIHEGYKNYQNFADHCIEDGTGLAERYIDRGMDLILAAGIFTLSKDEFYNECIWSIQSKWIKLFHLLEGVNQKADETIQEAAQRRELRKAARSRLHGVGFGAAGAIGSYALSGGMNALSGLLHSTANAIGNAGTRSEVQKKLNQIYHSEELFEQAKSCVYQGVMAIWDVVLSHLNLQQGDWKSLLIPEEERRKAKAYCENFDRIPPKERDRIAAEILCAGIADIGSYEVLVHAYQDPDGILAQAAQAFGLEEEYGEVLDRAIEEKFHPAFQKYVAQLDAAEISTLRQTLQQVKNEAQQALIALCGAYHVGEKGEVFIRCWYKVGTALERQASQRIRWDQQQRTYRDVVYRTCESADQAKNIWEDVERIQQEFSGKKGEEQEKLLHQLQQLHKNAPEQLKPAVEEMVANLTPIYEETDRKERTFLNFLFDTKADCERARGEYDKFKVELDKGLHGKQLYQLEKTITEADLFPIVKQNLLAHIKEESDYTLKEKQRKYASCVQFVIFLLIGGVLLIFPVVRFGTVDVRIWDMVVNVFTGGDHWGKSFLFGADFCLLILHLFHGITGIREEYKLKTAAKETAVYLLIPLGIGLVMNLAGENISFLPEYTTCIFLILMTILVHKVLNQS